MTSFAIRPLKVANGEIALSPVPGRSGNFEADFQTLLNWRPDIVFTMTGLDELAHVNATELPTRLSKHGIAWVHLPITDFGTPSADIQNQWPTASQLAQQTLTQGGKILIHCFGGCGRSGMAALRLMTELGEDPSKALTRLRQTRPCAVETEAQLEWAQNP